MSTLSLQTPRLRLRRARMDDLADIHAVLSDPLAMRYWSTLPHQTLAQSEDWLRAMVAADPALSDDFVIEFEGRVIGKAGCWRRPDIGYVLHSSHWRKGLGREALQAVISHLFAAHVGPQALRADVDPRNQASLGLLASLGFVETHRASRTWHIGDEWCDSVYLALPRDAWPARRCA